MIGAVFSETAGSAVADPPAGEAGRLIFPVLADNHNIAQNNKNPRSYGWYVNITNGFGGYYPENPVGGANNPYHPAEDWNRTDGRDNSGNEPVYSIGNGVIARIEHTNNTYGGAILVRYSLAKDMDFAPYFLPNTTVKELYRRGKYIIAQYMHVAVDTNLQERQTVSLGQRLGTIISVYNAKTFQHLHFEIMVDPNGDTFATTSRNELGYYPSLQGITDDGYIDPTKFILGYNLVIVGQRSNLFITDYSSQAFIDAFNCHSPKIGWPTNYVHKWTGQYDTSYRVWIQDFQGDTNVDHFGADGKTAIILNDYLQPYKAYLVKEGIWGYYKTNDGPFALGQPFTEEIKLRYANSPYNQAGDPVRAGETITAQKFIRVYERYGQPAYDNDRRTLVYNNSRGGKIVQFAVGEVSIGEDICPTGEQIYIKADSNPANDVVWPLLGVLTPTGKWFTKPGQYGFARHEANGQRLNDWGISAVVSETNTIYSLRPGQPTNLRIINVP